MSIIFFCENITKNYNNEPVVEDVSLELPAGGFISLVGPSGVGKTTLFNVLAGVDKPDRGRVFLNDENITGISGRVSYMLQKDLLLEYRTVLDNVILPLLIKGGKIKTAREYAAGFFPMFGLENCEKKYPRELSGGMRQRAALLRTCLTAENRTGDLRPVILLDEPFSSLDAITRRTMQSWYAGIARQMNVSTLFITHDVEEALLLSDTVYIMTGIPGETTRGKPGKITNKFEVQPPRSSDSQGQRAGFSVSKEFIEQKHLILKAIGLDV